MTKTALKNEIIAWCGAPLLTLNDVAKVCKIGKDKTKSILADYDYYDMGNSRRYSADDVADALMKLRRR